MGVVQNALMKGLRKKLAGTVYYQLGGQTIQRALAEVVKNPRTFSQMDRRVRLANLVNLYRANKGWMQKAFETKKKNQSDYNAFVSRNFNASPVAFTKEEAAMGACVVYPYLITQGSLPPYQYQASADGTKQVSDLFLGTVFTLTAETTVAEFSAAVIANNISDKKGDQLSIIMMYQAQSPSTGVPYVSVRSHELILDPNDSKLLSKFLPTSFLSVVNGALAFNTNSFQGGFCMIQSRTEGGKTYVSSQNIVVTDASLYAPYISSSQQAKAIVSYGSNDDVFLDATRAGQADQAALTASISQVTIAGVVRAASTYVGPVANGAAVTIQMSSPVTLPETGNAIVVRGRANAQASTQPVDVNIPVASVTVNGSSLSFTMPSALEVPLNSIAVLLSDGSQVAITYQIAQAATPGSGSGSTGGNSDDNPDGIE